MDILKDLAGLFRIKQWTKNGFLFFPIVFAGQFLYIPALKSVALAFVGFCIISSGIYVANDLIDIGHDRHHPNKMKRALRLERLPRWFVFSLSGAAILSGTFLCALVDPLLVTAVLAYLLINVFYNVVAKKMVIIDVIFIAFGFLVRIWAGAIAAGVMPSVWIQMCVFLLALFLGFSKRRAELSLLKNEASRHRHVLAQYSLYFLDQLIMLTATLTVVFYGLYTISHDMPKRVCQNALVYSIVFVIYGLARYLYLVHKEAAGGDPAETLLADRPFLIGLLGWLVYCSFVIYYLPRF